MRRIQSDVRDLKERRVAFEDDIRRLESDMLKGANPRAQNKNTFTYMAISANTRKEEIARFNRANTDAEFARMLKIRTLGPEHLETQSQLRRDIRVSDLTIILLL
jgi:nucleoporin NUP159